jgi:hypothetical protein
MEVIQDLIDNKIIKVNISIVDCKTSYSLDFDTLKEIIKLSLEDKNFYDYLYAIFSYIFITIELDKHPSLQRELELYEIQEIFYIFREKAKYDIIYNHKTIYIKTKVAEKNLKYLEEFLNEVFELIEKYIKDKEK